MDLFYKKKKEKNKKKAKKILQGLYSCKQARPIDGKRDRRGQWVQLLVHCSLCCGYCGYYDSDKNLSHTCLKCYNLKIQSLKKVSSCSSVIFMLATYAIQNC